MPLREVPAAVRKEFDAINQQILAGLDRAAELEVGGGFVDVKAGITSAAGGGAFARIEAGLHPIEPLDVFAYLQMAAPLAPSTVWAPSFEGGAGARLRW